jgi:hypothetical protein
VVFGQAWGPVGPVRTKVPLGGDVRVPISSIGRRAGGRFDSQSGFTIDP